MALDDGYPKQRTVARSGFSLVWRRKNQLLAGYQSIGKRKKNAVFIFLEYRFTFLNFPFLPESSFATRTNDIISHRDHFRVKKSD